MVENEQSIIMEKGINYLLSFNPSNTNPDLLEKALIGRRHIVKDLEKRVIESAETGNKHQALLVAPRGSGKTHTLKALHNRLIANKKLKSKLVIAYLIEDEYGVATFLDWIIRIFKSFIRWNSNESKYLEGEIEKLKKTPEDYREGIAQQVLLEHIKGKTLLVIVENLENIFDNKKGFGLDGQQKFRDLIQQNPVFTIVASNQAMFGNISHEDKPFHNFFSIINLKKLSLDETIKFLQSIAEYDKNTKLLEFLKSGEGINRIEAIYDIIGGNHRLLVTFYKFFKTEYIYQLSEPFIKTINDLIPFYQSMMSLLSAQQQKIIQYLCQTRIPTTGKQIMENCFLAQNVASKQLSNLLKLRYIDVVKTGRESTYELSEPLLRICFELIENRCKPVKLFVDFLSNLYSSQVLRKKFMQFHLMAQESQNLGNENFKIEADYYKHALENTQQSMLKEPDNEGYLILNKGVLGSTFSFKEAIQMFYEVTKKTPNHFWANFNIVTCLIGLGKTDKAIGQLKLSLKVAAKNKISKKITEPFEEIILTLLQKATSENIKTFLVKSLKLIEESAYIDLFYQSFPNAILEFLRQINEIGNEKLESINSLLNELFDQVEDMIVPLKFLDVGIRYLAKKEKNVLLRLTKEERATFSKLVLEGYDL